jgi:hypothetical protein
MQISDYYRSSPTPPASRSPMRPPSLDMSSRNSTEQGSGRRRPERQSFLTLDECIASADELAQRLRQLGAQKHPLDIRKGIRPLPDKAITKTVRGASRTYFFDVRRAQDGRPFLVITESRLREKQRVQITIFSEQAQEFLEALTAVTTQL